jgi:hypothetical protein
MTLAGAKIGVLGINPQLFFKFLLFAVSIQRPLAGYAQVTTY